MALSQKNAKEQPRLGVNRISGSHSAWNRQCNQKSESELATAKTPAKSGKVKARQATRNVQQKEIYE
jgi:hypothetical protein